MDKLGGNPSICLAEEFRLCPQNCGRIEHQGGDTSLYLLEATPFGFFKRNKNKAYRFKM